MFLCKFGSTVYTIATFFTNSINICLLLILLANFNRNVTSGPKTQKLSFSGHHWRMECTLAKVRGRYFLKTPSSRKWRWRRKSRGEKGILQLQQDHLFRFCRENLLTFLVSQQKFPDVSIWHFSNRSCDAEAALGRWTDNKRTSPNSLECYPNRRCTTLAWHPTRLLLKREKKLGF